MSNLIMENSNSILVYFFFAYLDRYQSSTTKAKLLELKAYDYA